MEELLNHYSESETDLSRFLIETIGIPPNDVVRARKIKNILNNFKEDGYLTWKTARMVAMQDGTQNWDWDNQSDYMAMFGTETLTDKGTLGNTRVEAQLTIKGLEFATDIVRSRITYNSTVNTNRWMIGLTLIIAISTALNLVCNKPKDYAKELQPKQQRLEELLKSHQQQLNNVQNTLHQIQEETKAIIDSLSRN